MGATVTARPGPGVPGVSYDRHLDAVGPQGHQIKTGCRRTGHRIVHMALPVPHVTLSLVARRQDLDQAADELLGRAARKLAQPIVAPQGRARPVDRHDAVGRRCRHGRRSGSQDAKRWTTERFHTTTAR